MRTNKIVTREDIRLSISRTFKEVSDIVGSTMGPAGLPVIIQKGEGYKDEVTKDGVTVAENLNPSDNTERLATNLIVQAAKEANSRGGDGTTTATVLAAALTGWLNQHEDAHVRLRQSFALKKLPKLVETAIAPYVLPAKDLETLTKVTAISANGDITLADLVAGAMFDSDGHARIRVSQESYLEDDIINRKNIEIMSRSSNLDKTKSYLSKILLIDGELDDEALSKLAGITSKDPVFVICSRIEHGTASMLRRLSSRNVNVVALPHAGSVTGLVLGDISKVLGVSLLTLPELMSTTDIAIIKLDDKFNVTASGELVSVTIPEERMDFLSKVTSDLESIMDDKSSGKRSIAAANKRYEVVSPHVYELQLAAVTDFEYGERLARAIDCINACRNAYKFGVVPGGGMGALFASNVINKEREALGLTPMEVTELTSVFGTPIKVIAANAYGGSGFQSPLEEWRDLPYTSAFNVFTGTLEPYDKNYIIDPLEVVLSSLNAAIGLATTVATTGGAIILNNLEEG